MPLRASAMPDVRPGRTGQGLGQALLIRALPWVAQAVPGQPMHLLVLANNTAARRFSVRHGGVLVETRTRRLPDCSTPPVVRYRWDGPS